LVNKVAVIRKLLEYKADLNAADNQGNTGLHMASCCGFDATVTYLLGKGADKSIVNKEGKLAKDVALGSSTAALFD
jgi:ankyrin repeat protein